MGWSDRILAERRREREAEARYIGPFERYCPRCRSLLVIRTNRANQSQFFGCTSWPECEFTEPIPEYVKLRRQGNQPLPGME